MPICAARAIRRCGSLPRASVPEEDDGDLGLGDLGENQDAEADDADWLDDEYDGDLWADGPSSYHPDPFAPAPDPALSEGQERARTACRR